MRLIDGIRARLRLLFSPASAESRMEEEIGFHIEMETERLVREEGLDPAEARRRALVAFGGVERYKEELRSGRGLAWLGGLRLDLKLGLRMLVKHPGLTLVGGLALAIAIGAGAAYFDFVKQMYRPELPLEEGDRLVGLLNWDVADNEPDPQSLFDLGVWREQLMTVRELGAAHGVERNLILGEGRVEPVEAVEISASAFRVTDVQPQLGRPLLDSDQEPGAPPVVVLGHRLWKTRFGGDPRILDRTIRLGRDQHRVVGVMPEGFGFPVSNSLWLPLRLEPAAVAAGEGPSIRVFGQLAPGVELEQAQAELAAVGARLATAHPETHRDLRPQVLPYVESLWSFAADGPAARAILYGLNLFFLALLGVCGINVATLVFARTATRQGEITVRSALGASRSRVLVQMFAEALVLAVVAAAVGLAGASALMRWAVGGMLTSQGVEPLFWMTGRLSRETILYSIALTLLAALTVGLLPGLKATGRRLHGGLKELSMGGSGMRFGRFWTGVIVAQVGLTVLFLLVVAAIGWNMVTRTHAAQFGFPPERVLSLRVDGGAPDAYQRLEQQLLSEPEVAGITYASQLPGMNHPYALVEVDGLGGEQPAPRYMKKSAVDPDFFGSLEVPVVAGRTFRPSDLESDVRPVVVDQTFARTFLGGRSPIGMRLREVEPGTGEAGAWGQIVGVVEDLAESPEKEAQDAVLYRPATPAELAPLRMAIRVRSDLQPLAARLPSLAAAVDPEIRLYEVMPLTETDRALRIGAGYLLKGLAVVGGILLLLSLAGVYSLMAFAVSRRRREIGIRTAVGANPRRILTGIFGSTIAQIGIGVVAGVIPGTLVLLYGLPEVLRGSSPATASAAVAAVAAFVLVVGLAAAIVPARRALRVQPTEALRPGE